MIGHGALAEKAVKPVLPVLDATDLMSHAEGTTEGNFPYAIRVTSETTSSDGSSSMASVCGATIALQDAGVPISAPVAGVSIGLMSRLGIDWENAKESDWALLTDIRGMEDHFGDMDFKIAGTEEGITAVQLDIKCPWLPLHVLTEALEPAAVARGKIIETIREATAVASEKEGIPVRQLLVLPKPSHAGFIIGSGGAKKAELEEELGVKINVARRDATEARGIVEIVADSKGENGDGCGKAENHAHGTYRRRSRRGQSCCDENIWYLCQLWQPAGRFCARKPAQL